MHLLTQSWKLFVLSLLIGLQLQAQNLTPGKKKINPKAKQKNAAASRQRGPVSSDFIEQSEHGQVNWTDQYIEAEGSSIMDTTRFKLKNQARLMAQRGAIVDAQRNLLETVNGVLVEGQTTVKDLVVQSDEVKTKVSGMLKGASQVGKTRYEDGVAYVRLRIPLYADGLGEAVDTTPAPEPTPAVTPTGDSIPQQVMVSVAGTSNFRPRLFPKLTDAQNNIIWDMANSFDPTKGKAPQIVKQGAEALQNIKGKKGVELLEAVTDSAGNLVLNEKSKAKMEKWKQAGLIVWGILKKLILPI